MGTSSIPARNSSGPGFNVELGPLVVQRSKSLRLLLYAIWSIYFIFRIQAACVLTVL